MAGAAGRKMGRIAVVTGASSGIWRALTLELAGEGYDLGLTARRTEIQSLRNRASRLQAPGPDAARYRNRKQ